MRGTSPVTGLAPLGCRAIALLLAVAPAVAAQQYDKYVWEAHRAENIGPEVAPLVEVLREEIDKILAAGHLRPLRAYHTDLKGYGYFVYQEPGRIITTLGLAYPYLSDAQRDRVRAYVGSELADPDYAPWSSSDHLPIDNGAYRNYADMT
jgi:hypothetical protein